MYSHVVSLGGIDRCNILASLGIFIHRNFNTVLKVREAGVYFPTPHLEGIAVHISYDTFHYVLPQF